jgi:cytosine/uracil/thiamine/allantoin permease
MKVGNELDLYRAGYGEDVAQKSSRLKIKIAPFNSPSVCNAFVLHGVEKIGQGQTIAGSLKIVVEFLMWIFRVRLIGGVEIFVATSTHACHNTYWPWITPRVFTA